jgi:hypothetical protein
MNDYFLLFSLFFPRAVLVIFAVFFPAQYPMNSVPLWADVTLGVVMPRALILLYIHQNLDANNGWFMAHMLVMVLTYLGVGRASRRQWRRIDD